MYCPDCSARVSRPVRIVVCFTFMCASEERARRRNADCSLLFCVSCVFELMLLYERRPFLTFTISVWSDGHSHGAVATVSQLVAREILRSYLDTLHSLVFVRAGVFVVLAFTSHGALSGGRLSSSDIELVGPLSGPRPPSLGVV
eukprot:6175189-Pleurochrysis_carterae.AAC.2